MSASAHPPRTRTGGGSAKEEARRHWPIGAPLEIVPPASAEGTLRAEYSLSALLEKGVGPHSRQQRRIAFEIDRHLENLDVGRTACAAQSEVRR